MTLTLPKTMIAGTPENVNDVQANDAYLAAAIDLTNTAAGVSSATGWRGKSIIATEEAVTSTSYATLTTPDQVTGVVMPTDGLIRVLYQALWKESASATATAAIFVGSNQVKQSGRSSSYPVTQQASHIGSASSSNVYVPLVTTSYGLGTASAVTAPSDDVTTGQLVGMPDEQLGGACYIFAAAGTYTISVKFKSTSGSVTAKARKLWVSAEGF